MTKRKIVELESIIRKSSESGYKKHKILPNITSFKISDENLNEFTRHFPRPMDCVINALQLINYIDFKIAAMLRLLVGNEGIGGDKIEQIFNMMNNHKYDYKFKEYHLNYIELQNLLDEFLLPGQVMFIGVSRKYINTSLNHVTIIGRYLNRELVIIDPQMYSKPIVISDFKEWASMYETFYILTIENLSKTTSTLPDIITLRAKNVSNLTSNREPFFKVKDLVLSKYINSNPTPKYAVINSLELIGYIDIRTLYLLQIVMIKNVGLCMEDLENILTVLNDNKKFTFVNDNFEQIINEIPNGFLTYCGVKWYTGGKHPLIIGKTVGGTKYIINPQTWSVNDYEELKYAAEYYTLRQTIL